MPLAIRDAKQADSFWNDLTWTVALTPTGRDVLCCLISTGSQVSTPEIVVNAW